MYVKTTLLCKNRSFSLAPLRSRLSRFASCALRQGFDVRGVNFSFGTALYARTVKPLMGPLSFRNWSGTSTLHDCYEGTSRKCGPPALTSKMRGLAQVTETWSPEDPSSVFGSHVRRAWLVCQLAA